MRITTVRDAEAAAARAADVVNVLLDEAIAARGLAHLALAGGSTPKRCHELLAERRANWDGVHLWESDERCVPPDDDESNWKMIEASLVSRISIAADQLHRAPGELGPDASAEAYEEELRRVIGGAGVPVLDVCMCGLGEDGHTMSLFPGHPEVRERERLVVGVRDSPKPPPERLTFTLPVAHAARLTILLTAGASKADALAAVVDPTRREDERVPSSMLRGGRLEVIADDAAAPSNRA